jgi:hypothetical protein
MMDSAEIGVLVGGISLIVFTLWFFFGRKSEKSTPAADGAVIYACPMHPWITSTDPTANCSICGMKLVRSGTSLSN